MGATGPCGPCTVSCLVGMMVVVLFFFFWHLYSHNTGTPLWSNW
jgi:hypothetical protein